MANQPRKIEFTGLPAKRVGATQDYFQIKIGGHKVYLPPTPYRMIFKMACQKVLNIAKVTPPYLSQAKLGQTKTSINNAISKLRKCMREKGVPESIIRWNPTGVMLGIDGRKIIFRYNNLMLSLDEDDKVLLKRVADARPKSIRY